MTEYSTKVSYITWKSHVTADILTACAIPFFHLIFWVQCQLQSIISYCTPAMPSEPTILTAALFCSGLRNHQNYWNHCRLCLGDFYHMYSANQLPLEFSHSMFLCNHFSQPTAAFCGYGNYWSRIAPNWVKSCKDSLWDVMEKCWNCWHDLENIKNEWYF